MAGLKRLKCKRDPFSRLGLASPFGPEDKQTAYEREVVRVVGAFADCLELVRCASGPIRLKHLVGGQTIEFGAWNGANYILDLRPAGKKGGLTVGFHHLRFGAEDCGSLTWRLLAPLVLEVANDAVGWRMFC